MPLMVGSTFLPSLWKSENPSLHVSVALRRLPQNCTNHLAQHVNKSISGRHRMSISLSKVNFQSIDTTLNSQASSVITKKSSLHDDPSSQHPHRAQRPNYCSFKYCLGCLTFFCDVTSVGFANVEHAGE